MVKIDKKLRHEIAVKDGAKGGRAIARMKGPGYFRKLQKRSVEARLKNNK